MNKYSHDDNEVVKIRNIVNETFRVNIMEKSRGLEFVQGRMTFSRLLRERGYSIQDIANGINKHHATVIHYFKTIDRDMKYDSGFRKQYDRCHAILHTGDDPLFSMSKPELIVEVMTLVYEIRKLRSPKNPDRLPVFVSSDNESNDDRLKGIFNLIRNSTPYGEEVEVEEKIKHILYENCLAN
jgi:hypothetical protein